MAMIRPELGMRMVRGMQVVLLGNGGLGVELVWLTKDPDLIWADLCCHLVVVPVF